MWKEKGSRHTSGREVMVLALPAGCGQRWRPRECSKGAQLARLTWRAELTLLSCLNSRPRAQAPGTGSMVSCPAGSSPGPFLLQICAASSRGRRTTLLFFHTPDHGLPPLGTAPWPPCEAASPPSLNAESSLPHPTHSPPARRPSAQHTQGGCAAGVPGPTQIWLAQPSAVGLCPRAVRAGAHCAMDSLTSRLGSEHVALLHLVCRMYIQASVPGSDAPRLSPLAVTSTGSHVFVLCLPPLPQQICIFLPDASVLLQRSSGPGTGMSLQPSGLTFPRRCIPDTSPMYTVQLVSVKQKQVPWFLPSLPGSFHYPNKGCQNVWWPRAAQACP